MFTCVLGRCIVASKVLLSTQTFRRAPTASVDSCADTKECPNNTPSIAGSRSCVKVEVAVLDSPS